MQHAQSTLHCKAFHSDKKACAGATTYRTVLDVDRGLSWADAVAMRDAHVAEVTEDGGTVDPLVGFHLFTTQKEIGKTGEARSQHRPALCDIACVVLEDKVGRLARLFCCISLCCNLSLAWPTSHLYVA